MKPVYTILLAGDTPLASSLELAFRGHPVRLNPIPHPEFECPPAILRDWRCAVASADLVLSAAPETHRMLTVLCAVQTRPLVYAGFPPKVFYPRGSYAARRWGTTGCPDCKGGSAPGAPQVGSEKDEERAVAGEIAAHCARFLVDSVRPSWTAAARPDCECPVCGDGPPSLLW